MNIILNVDVFKGIEDAPFYMEVEIAGYFELEGEDDITKYEANAIAIMYPYLRAIVSTYTSAANVAPVILPAINVNAMLKRKTSNSLFIIPNKNERSSSFIFILINKSMTYF